MDKKIPDTVVGILEHSGNFVKIDEQGRFTVDGMDVSSNNIVDIMNGKKLTVSPPKTFPNLYQSMPIINAEPLPGIANRDLNYKQQLQDLKDFLTFKGIEVNEDELKDFIESRRLVEQMSKDPNAPMGFPSGFSIRESYGVGVINPKAIAKVIL